MEFTVEFYEDLVKYAGKFQGEKRWVPYFYDVMLGGEGEETEDGNIIFEVVSEDIRVFPELEGKKKVWLTISESGFVYGHTL